MDLSQRGTPEMPDAPGAVFCPNNPFAVVDSAVFSKMTIDIGFDPLAPFAVCGLGPAVHGVDVGKRVTGKARPTFAHLSNPVLVVVDEYRKGKPRDNSVQRRRQDRVLPF